jgi:glycosyltransferase involved in cell wall biosynthesis
MKIAIVQGAFLPVPPTRGGAVEKIWCALAREFALGGHEVVHYSRICDGLPSRETLDGVRQVRVPGADTPASLLALKFRDFLYTRRVARVLAPADVIVTNTFWAPVIFSPQRHGPLWVHVQRYPKGQMLLYGRAARLQTVSRVIADAMVRQHPSCRPRVCLIPNPLPAPVPLPRPVPRDPNLVLFVGRVHPEKGLELLLNAALLARRTAPHLRFRIVGPWETRLGGGGEPFRARLARLAAPLASVEFTGAIFDETQLAAHYAAASAFVYPSLAAEGEASPLAPLEALARGCPVVTSDLACFDDTIGEGPFAHRFDHTAPDAPARLAAALAAVVADRAAWSRASAAAAAHTAQFSVEKIADRYLAGFAAMTVAP